VSPETKATIEKRKIFGAIMSIFVIVLLFVPAYSTWYINDRWETQILTVEGLYENGTVFETYEPVDQTQIGRMWTDEEITADYSNNDSYYMKIHDAGIKRNKIAFTNFVAYIGDGNYTVTPNYTIQTSPPVYRWRGIGVPINVTSHELAEFDFLRLQTNDEHTAKYLQFERSFGKQEVAFQEVRNNTYMLIMTLGLKTNLLSSPDVPVYLFWDGQTVTALDDTDVTWTFKFNAFVLDPEHQFFWENEHLYILSLIPVGILWTFGLLLSTDIIDLKWDTKKKKKKG
jgi:hypothetical protein